MQSKTLTIVSVLLLLQACGGGNSSGPPQAPPDSQAPAVVIDYPNDEAIVASTHINVSGIVDDLGAVIRIDGETITNDNGFFEKVSYELPHPGAYQSNAIEVTATDAAGNVGIASVLIHVGDLDWLQSYDAGYTDASGAWAGGSEIMHLASHKGRLYAANGYWEDSRWEQPAAGDKQSAQVLRLDDANGTWQVDLDTGSKNDIGAEFMKGNILKSVTFTSDGDGNALPEPVNLLVMASGNLSTLVSVWVRDDTTGSWSHEMVQSGTAITGVRWVPRDIQIYRDKVTNIERIFVVLGNPGIMSGVYDATVASGIRWDTNIEFPSSGPFTTRPLGIAEANGKLYFSVGGVIFQRNNGPSPTYVEILNLGGGVNIDVGGIRGLTSIPNPNGAGESMLFVWAPTGASIGEIKRLDPDGFGGYTIYDETNLSDLMSNELGVAVPYTLGAHNQFYPFTHPVTGETVHVVGFQGRAPGIEPLLWDDLYAGAMYAIRTADQNYSIHEVNGVYRVNKAILVSPRTFSESPFGDSQIYVGGHDANFHNSDDMAWIFMTTADEFVTERGTD